MQFLRRRFLAFALVTAFAWPATADDNASQFDTRIAPVIARHCLECHNSVDRKGSLDLSNHAAATTGGESGSVIVPGSADDSLLWEKISSGEMPPENKNPLSASDTELLREWINSGAQWGAEKIDRFRYSSSERGGYDWWSLQPITRPQPPTVKNAAWTRGTIDRFVLARLEAAGLEPSPVTDRTTLIRRVYMDVTGLPPGTWAMPCVPIAGIQNGMFAMPIIGSGVWVEFEQGDPDQPIWVGCFWGSAAEVPALARLTPPVLPAITLQTPLQNGVTVSDMQGPTGGIMIKSATGATLIVNDTGIYIQNGKGAMITMVGPTVTINNGALTII
jgi:hypothetical protein